MSDPYLGQIIIFAGNFAPKNWAFCQGQLLSVQQNAALFAILGTTYGGNGASNFALPDLRGRVPVGFGQGPGLSSYALGQQFGQEGVTLAIGQMPNHSHNVLINPAAGTQAVPTGNFLAQTGGKSAADTYSNASGSGTFLNAAAVQSQGGSLAHENRQPSLALNYIIALNGIFPSRD